MLTQEYVKELFDYRDGKLFRKVSKGAAKAGSRAGCLMSDGYRQVSIDRKFYKEHRIIFLLFHGYMPENDIDHLDGNPDNNHIQNLREVAHSCNLQNQKIYKNNSSGFPGVYWDKQLKKFRAQIMIHGKQKYLGCYNNPLEAALVRYTVEVNCFQWTCNHRSELVKRIKQAWPDFRISS